MVHSELLSIIQSTPWFTSLGQAKVQPPFVAITDLDQWESFIRGATAAEFGIVPDNDSPERCPFARLDWLPTSHDQTDPIHANRLDDEAVAIGKLSEFKSARLEAFKLAAVSQRGLQDHSLLRFGGSDLNEAARSSGKYACRMAASEIAVGKSGLWCEIVLTYRAGNWPLGRLASGEIVVL